MMSTTMKEIENHMSPRELWGWAGWRMFKDNCRRRRDPGYNFDSLSEEEKLEDYIKFKKVYDEERQTILPA